MLPTLILSTILNMFSPYDRDLYGGWIDADGDCQNTQGMRSMTRFSQNWSLSLIGCGTSNPFLRLRTALLLVWGSFFSIVKLIALVMLLGWTEISEGWLLTG